MLKGTHHSKTKNQLSEKERELLNALLEMTHTGAKKVTAKKVAEMMDWDIRTTTVTLSNIVGLDLCNEEDVKTFKKEGTDEFSSSEPLYGFERDSTIHKRALYAKDRTTGTLWHLINTKDYGENLWPNRPIDRIQYTGKVVLVGGIPQVSYKYRPDDLKDMIGQDVKITIQS